MPIIDQSLPNKTEVYRGVIRTVSDNTSQEEALLGYEAFLDALELHGRRAEESDVDGVTGRRLAISIVIDRMPEVELRSAITLINERLKLLMGWDAEGKTLPVEKPEQVESTANETFKSCVCAIAFACDGAVTWDGKGFNGCDTSFGRWTAKQFQAGRSISRRQAQATHKMMVKYKKQLSSNGLTLPDWAAIEHCYPEGQVIAKPEKRVEMKENGSEVAVFTIPSENHHFKPLGYLRFSWDDRSWRFTPTKIAEIMEKAESLEGYYIDLACQTAYDKEMERRAVEQEEKERKALEAASEITQLAAIAKLDQPIACGWKLFDHQVKGAEWLLAHGKAGIHRGGILADQMGLGKAQPLQSKVYTPTGWKYMGDIQVGDRVINSQGKSSKVTGVYPQGLRDIYRVIFTDGSSVECCDDHLWAVQSPDRKHRGAGFVVKPLSNIRATLKQKNGNLNHYIPIVKPIEFEERGILIDPYVLGLLLGDGGVSQDSVFFTTADTELKNSLDSYLQRDRGCWLVPCIDSDITWRIVANGVGEWRQNPIVSDLKRLGIMGHSSLTKFIPESYLYSSVATRIALLRGLMDTDGSTSNGVVEFSSSSYRLAEGVRFLVESLGGKTTFKTRMAYYRNAEGKKIACQPHHRLTISLPSDICPFRLSRKVAVYVPKSKYQPYRGIKEVYFVGKEYAQCISVDAPDHLYVTDHCVVTHNTIEALTAAKAVKEFYNCHVIVICPSSLRDNWLIEAQMVGVKVDVYSWAKMPSPLMRTRYIVIADEAHYAQNPNSQRTKNLWKLTRSDLCLYAWMLTGTPLKNGRPINLFPLLYAVDHPLSRDRRAYEKTYCQAGYSKVSKHRTIWDNTGASCLDDLSKMTTDVILQRKKHDCLDLPEKLRSYRPVDLDSLTLKAYEKEISEAVATFKERAALGLVDKNAETLVTLQLLRRIGSKYKAGDAIAVTHDLLEQGEQVVLFTEFLESAQAIASELSQSVKVELLTGDVPGDQRQAMKERFQAGESKVFVGTIKAGGVGITLTAASYVILVDRPWTPGDTEQAEDRCHRIGQVNTVIPIWLQLSAIDKMIDNLIERKQQRIDLVMAGKRKTLRGVGSIHELAKELIESL